MKTVVQIEPNARMDEVKARLFQAGFLCTASAGDKIWGEFGRDAVEKLTPIKGVQMVAQAAKPE